MTDDKAKAFLFSPFDVTKVWTKGEFPLFEVGQFECNGNPENYFAEFERAAISPANVVPSVSFSPDNATHSTR